MAGGAEEEECHLLSPGAFGGLKGSVVTKHHDHKNTLNTRACSPGHTRNKCSASSGRSPVPQSNCTEQYRDVHPEIHPDIQEARNIQAAQEAAVRVSPPARVGGGFRWSRPCAVQQELPGDTAPGEQQVSYARLVSTLFGMWLLSLLCLDV